MICGATGAGGIGGIGGAGGSVITIHFSSVTPAFFNALCVIITIQYARSLPCRAKDRAASRMTQFSSTFEPPNEMLAGTVLPPNP